MLIRSGIVSTMDNSAFVPIPDGQWIERPNETNCEKSRPCGRLFEIFC